MKVTVAHSLEEAAAVAASILAAEITGAVAARGMATIALSGGQTPWRMLEALLDHPLPWRDLHVFQVDERVVPPDDDRRNARLIQELLVRNGGLPAAQFHAMPVDKPLLDTATSDYSRTMAEYAGVPPQLDVVQLGLGPDGHTASLIPGDPLLMLADADVGISLPYQGTRRLSLTFAVLNRARRILWLVTGEPKAAMLARLVLGDTTIPAGHVARDQAIAVADVAAAAMLP